jgi:glycosyltransferase involved in cell wall biosynthesis
MAAAAFTCGEMVRHPCEAAPSMAWKHPHGPVPSAGEISPLSSRRAVVSPGMYLQDPLARMSNQELDPARSIRVAHCIRDTSACGAQEVLRLLLATLDPERFESTVFTFKWGDAADRIVRQGVEVVELQPRVRLLDPTLVSRLRARLSKGGFDILHMHLFGAILHGSLAARRLDRLASVITLHSDREDNRRQRWVYGRLLESADWVVACSDDVAGAMRRRYDSRLAGRFCTIPNGVDAARFSVDSRSHSRFELGLDENTPVVLSVGRLSEEKGHSVLLNALPALLSRFPDLELLIAGEGSLRSRLEGLVEKLQLGRHVRFLGARSDVPEIFATADVFVLSSLWEGLPMALLEAMASGLPCVATRVGGIPQAMRDGVEGLVVPPNDAEALADALATCLENRELAGRLGQRARARVESEFSARRMASDYARLYEELVAERRRGDS